MDNNPLNRRGTRGHGHWVTGLTLIGLGSLFLLERQGYIEIGAWTHYWPFIIAAVGLCRIADARTAAHVAKGGFMVFLAFWLYACLEHLWGMSFRHSWPMVLVALGVEYMVAGLSKPTADSNNKAAP